MTDGERICKLVDRAMEGIENLSLNEQRDLHQAAAVILFSVDRKRAEVTAHAVDLLNEFERHQLKFRELLKS